MTDVSRTRIGGLRWVAAAAAFVNLGIHLALAPDHLAEMRYIGVLFVIGSALLGMVMAGLASDRDRLRVPAWIGGSAVSAVEFVLFVISRTAGLPGGYLEEWTGSVENYLGLASLFVELVFVACAVASLAGSSATVRERRGTRHMPLHDRTAPLG